MSKETWPRGHRSAKAASMMLDMPYRKVLKWCQENKVRKEPQGWAITNAQMKKLAKIA
jgi:hypothetical protein